MGPKYLTIGYLGILLGIVILVLGRYLIVGYLDPSGGGLGADLGESRGSSPPQPRGAAHHAARR